MNSQGVQPINESRWHHEQTKTASPHLYCWWSLVLRVFAIKRSASFSRFLEYSISISAFFLKKSWRSCSSWTLISVCWSRHFCCSTSWARISEETQQVNKQVRTETEPECWGLKSTLCLSIISTEVKTPTHKATQPDKDQRLSHFSLATNTTLTNQRWTTLSVIS